MIKRDLYLQRLINSKHNGFPKVITGIRRCGKSYLLKEIFYQHLKDCGIRDDQILLIELDDDKNMKYRNPVELNCYPSSGQ